MFSVCELVVRLRVVSDREIDDDKVGKGTYDASLVLRHVLFNRPCEGEAAIAT